MGGSILHATTSGNLDFHCYFHCVIKGHFLYMSVWCGRIKIPRVGKSIGSGFHLMVITRLLGLNRDRQNKVSTTTKQQTNIVFNQTYWKLKRCIILQRDWHLYLRHLCQPIRMYSFKTGSWTGCSVCTLGQGWVQTCQPYHGKECLLYLFSPHPFWRQCLTCHPYLEADAVTLLTIHCALHQANAPSAMVGPDDFQNAISANPEINEFALSMAKSKMMFWKGGRHNIIYLQDFSTDI